DLRRDGPGGRREEREEARLDHGAARRDEDQSPVPEKPPGRCSRAHLLSVQPGQRPARKNASPFFITIRSPSPVRTYIVVIPRFCASGAVTARLAHEHRDRVLARPGVLA